MSNPDLGSFAQFIPGFDFLQNLTRQAASGAVPGAATVVPGMPPMSHWVTPTFDVDELEKRIQDLRAVHFWLEQNSKALGATIQALEVQKMTLATLKTMNVSLGEVAEAFKIKPQPVEPEAPPPQAAPAEPPQEPGAVPQPEASTAAPAVDPMQWWGALTQQFQTIAGDVMRDMAGQVAQTAQSAADSVPPAAPARQAAAKRKAAPRKTAAPRAQAAPARKRG